MFDWFNKKNDDNHKFDKSNVGIQHLTIGWYVDYETKTWEVKDHYEYDWGKDFFTDEFKLVAIGTNETIYLHIEQDGDNTWECTLTNEFNISTMEEDVPAYIIANETAPRKIDYKGKTFFRAEESYGYFRSIQDEEWDEFVGWDYYDEAEKEILSIEQWDEKDFSAAYGKVVEYDAFTNVLPAVQ